MTATVPTARLTGPDGLLNTKYHKIGLYFSVSSS